ncbi:ArsB/NhaD family transporter [Streptomyces sp. RKND-216]|uniref:ArsB/NhaD family transporter n=1 Tax=Streptomyces sp. RKND-216 TaxID=2562581 RepID=UPI001FFAF719|nr:ArsB/NhaD family transporter [Streptomyces sp. RKND-216]
MATGLLDVGAAEAALVRLAPLLAFLASVIVLAELTGAAGDRVLFAVPAVATTGFLAAILGAEVPLWAASGAAALVVVGAFAVRRPGVLRPSLVPWRLLVLVPGLFLVVETVTVHGLHGWLVTAMGADGGVVGMFRSAAVGAGLSNVLNNLPVYLAGEGAVPVCQPQRLAALLIGTNVGALVVPWASLATLLCLERCRRHRTRVPADRFVVTGLVLSLAATAAATGALALLGR